MSQILYECTSCPLSRTCSKARELTEQQIIHDARCLDHTHIVYATYGSGGLGFELHCLTRLIEQGYDAITIVAIDKDYPIAEYSDGHKKLCKHIPDAEPKMAHDTPYRRIRTLYRRLKHHAAYQGLATYIHIITLPHAASYDTITTTYPHMRADICTWIDPDTSITPASPYTHADAAYLPHCCKDKATDYILTINNQHEPTLIASSHEASIMQRACWNIPDGTTTYTATLCNMPLYYYDPVPAGIQINGHVYTPTHTIDRHTVQLLKECIEKRHIHRICIPEYVHIHLRYIIRSLYP